MKFLIRSEVEEIITKAIYEKKWIQIKYVTVGTQELKERKKAPFDLGSGNPDIKYRERNKDMLYLYCFDHFDAKKGIIVPQVHPHSALQVVSINILDECFDPVKLTDQNLLNTKYDYRKCRWAIACDRNWY